MSDTGSKCYLVDAVCRFNLIPFTATPDDLYTKARDVIAGMQIDPESIEIEGIYEQPQ